jgi:hypothetical protein
LWAFGNNQYGQLGDRSNTNRNDPIQIMSGVAKAAAGGTHSLVLKRDGTLWAFGDNSHSKLGDGTAENHNVPVQILSSVASVSAGGNHSLVIKKDGTLWAFGHNGAGELGDGTNENRNTPVRIMSDVVRVSTGSFHSLVVKRDGTVWAFGNNNYGQLGDGTTEDRNIPVRILNLLDPSSHPSTPLPIASETKPPTSSQPTSTQSAPKKANQPQPTYTQNTLTIRIPSQDPTKLGIPRLYDFAPDRCDSIDGPGEVKSCRVQVNAGSSYAWGSAWCAGKSSFWPNLINSTSFQYFIDGRAVSPDQFWSERTSTCLRRRLVLEGFQSGSRHTAQLIINVIRDVSDGSDLVRAGRYELRLNIEVQ